MDGGDNTDTLMITGTTGGETLDVVFDGTAITEIEGGGSIVNVESVTADLLAGTDTLDYDDTTADVTVNLTTRHRVGLHLHRRHRERHAATTATTR